jgi:hypothetical protein
MARESSSLGSKAAGGGGWSWSLTSIYSRGKAWSHNSTPQYVFMVWYLVKHRDKYTFTFILFAGLAGRKMAFNRKYVKGNVCLISLWILYLTATNNYVQKPGAVSRLHINRSTRVISDMWTLYKTNPSNYKVAAQITNCFLFFRLSSERCCFIPVVISSFTVFYFLMAKNVMYHLSQMH